MTDYISRADAIDAVKLLQNTPNGYSDTYDKDCIIGLLEELPSADAVSREEYEETDGVVTIEKQNANEVGEIKHIVIHSPNYTRYFYNESMPLPSADAEMKCIAQIKVDTEELVRRIKEEYDISDGWVPCSERLPKEYAQYLVCLESGECDVYWLEDSDWARSMAEKEGILAWMPLPTPYKGGDDK